MKRKTTIITEEFDDKGNVVSRITETTEEEDSGYIYPQLPIYSPYVWPGTGTGTPTYKGYEITCNNTEA